MPRPTSGGSCHLAGGEKRGIKLDLRTGGICNQASTSHKKRRANVIPSHAFISMCTEENTSVVKLRLQQL